MKDFLRCILGRYANTSYSQEGEDLLLQRLFEYQKKGFYIDVGAYHPMRFSNTHLFYQRGWSGINIDATPGSMKLFNLIRRKDINIEVAIGQEIKKRSYFLFDEPALNTFDPILAEQRANNLSCRMISQVQINIMPLAKVLQENLNDKTKIDFLNVDVEGLDLEVLKSNDWQRFRPKYILAECSGPECDLTNYLKTQDYQLFANTVKTFFFKDQHV